MKFPKFSSNLIGALIIGITVCLIIASLQYDNTKTVIDTPEPPVPVVDVTIEVSVESSSGVYQGGGLRVGDIIVTSAMIFNGNDQIVTVDGIETEVIRRDDRLGLVALKSSITFKNKNVNRVPSIGEVVTLLGPRHYDVEIFRYMSEGDRMILSGANPAYAAGYPVMQGDNLVGIVVGLNSADIKQLIAVSSQGLAKFLGVVE